MRLSKHVGRVLLLASKDGWLIVLLRNELLSTDPKLPAIPDLFPLESGERVSSELALVQNQRVTIGVYKAREELEVAADAVAVCVCTRVHVHTRVHMCMCVYQKLLSIVSPGAISTFCLSVPSAASVCGVLELPATTFNSNALPLETTMKAACAHHPHLCG